MKKIKLLEIGAEGGGLKFYAFTNGSKTEYFFESNQDERFQTIYDMLSNYTKNNDPLLWYYPVEVHPDIKNQLLSILLNEYQSHPKDHFMNLETWEEKFGIQFEKLTNEGVQTFKITPIQKTETYNYNHFGDERVLESITKGYTDKPDLQQILTGKGSIEGSSFVIQHEDSVILGVFPLERYDVEPIK